MSHWYNPPGRKPLDPIPPDKLPGLIGKWIHLAWARNECRFTLEKIEGERITVSTGQGRDKKLFTSKAGDARYMRKNKK